MGKFSKKNKKFYLNKLRKPSNTNQPVIQPNMTGFLCTCVNSDDTSKCAEEALNLLNEFSNKLYGPEDENTTKRDDTSKCAEEALNLLNEFSNKLYGPEDENTTKRDNDTIEKEGSDAPVKMKEEITDSDDSDLESNFQAELEALQNRKADHTLVHSKNARFQRVYIHVHNSVFIATTLENPVVLSVAIMNHIKHTKELRTKTLCRMIPVLKTCKVSVRDIEKAAEEVILEHLPRKPISFCILFSFKNNNSVKKDDLLIKLSEFAHRLNPQLSVSFKTPDIVLSINVMQKICCLSLLPDYLTSYHKYNLQTIAIKPYIHYAELIKMKAAAASNSQLKQEEVVSNPIEICASTSIVNSENSSTTTSIVNSENSSTTTSIVNSESSSTIIVKTESSSASIVKTETDGNKTLQI